ncbi:MAG: hypothetical protein WC951_13255 [Bacteroidales bacterium]
MKTVGFFFSLVFFCLQFFSFSTFSQETISNGSELIEEMHAKYADNWYQHITLKQNMFRYKNDSLIRNEIWLVAYSSPTKLHIRYLDFSSGRGWLIVNDTLYSYNHNKLKGKSPRLHELIILGYDIYGASPQVTIPKIKQMGFDLSIVTQTQVRGNNVFQVGNPDSLCFWVHTDNLLFYGIRRVNENGTREIFYENYKEIYGKPVATEVQYLEDGYMYLYEKYFDIRLPSSMPSSFFYPERFDETRW